MIVQNRRADTNLRLFDSEAGVVIPGYLFERDKGKLVSRRFFGISVSGRGKLWKKIRRKHFRRQRARFKGDVPSQNFRAVVAGEPHWSDLARQTIHIQFG